MTTLTEKSGIIRLVNSGDEIHLPIASRIFLGEGLFETMAVRSGQVLSAAEHFSRMASSASRLQIPCPFTFAQWQAALTKLLSDKTLEHGGIKAILMAEAAERGLEKHAQHSTLYFFSFSEMAEIKPLKLISAPWRRDPQNPIYQHKTINYLEAIQAKRLAQASQADDLLFSDLNAFVLETSIANVFVVLNNTLVTPALSGAVLSGIARERMIAQAHRLGIAVEERSLSVSECEQSEGVFLSNALQAVQPVCALNYHPIALGHPLITALEQAEQRFSGVIEQQR